MDTMNAPVKTGAVEDSNGRLNDILLPGERCVV